MSTDDHSINDLYPPNPYAAPLAEEGKGPLGDSLADRRLSPWFSIWTEPRATIRWLVDTDPHYMLIPVVLLVGASSSVSFLANYIAEEGRPVEPTDFVVLGVGAVVVGLLAGPLLWFVNSWLVLKTASLLGGSATLKQMQAAYAWGSVPGIFTAVTGVPVVLCGAFVGVEIVAPVASLNNVVERVLGFWTFVAICKTVGEVSGFSAWRGCGATMLAGLLLAIAVFVLILLYVAGPAILGVM